MYVIACECLGAKKSLIELHISWLDEAENVKKKQVTSKKKIKRAIKSDNVHEHEHTWATFIFLHIVD